MNNQQGTQQTNTFIGGMNMDMDVNIIPENTYTYAENIRVVTNDDGSTGAITRSDGVEDIYQIDFEAFEYKGKDSNGVSHTEMYRYSREKIIHVDKIREYAIIFTESAPLKPYDETHGTLNRIFRLNFNNDPMYNGMEVDKKFCQCIAENEYDIAKPVSSTTIYESDTNIKIYWADGEHQIRSINILPDIAFKDYGGIDYYVTGGGSGSNTIDIMPPYPETKPIPTSITDITGGGLPNGEYQYIYVLRVPGAGFTSPSVPSDLIALFPNADKIASSDGPFYGGPKATSGGDGQSVEALSGCGINVRVSLTYDFWSKYSFIDLYRIRHRSGGHSAESDPELPALILQSRISDHIPIGADENYVANIDLFDGNQDTILVEEDIYRVDTNFRYSFAPRFLEQKDNILFAANIKETETARELIGVEDSGKEDEDGNKYGLDFRAYPFNSNGVTRFYDKLSDASNGDKSKRSEFTRDNILDVSSSSDVVYDHDSLTKHESSITEGINEEFYGYGFKLDEDGNPTDDIVLGGYGNIISYEFIVKQVVIDGNNGAAYNGLLSDYNFTIKKGNHLSPSPNGDNEDNIVYGAFTPDYSGNMAGALGHTLIPYNGEKFDVNSRPEYKFETGYENKSAEGKGYANPFIASCYKSLRRDEIYRYGIVFRGAGGQKTTAFWIGDIKTPCATVIPYFEVTKSDVNSVLCANVLGIRFTFNNKAFTAAMRKIGIPRWETSLKSYEIVRLRRDSILDKTIICSGVIQSLFPNAAVNSSAGSHTFYQPTWFTTSYGRRDCFSPRDINMKLEWDKGDIKDGNPRTRTHLVDYSINHPFEDNFMSRDSHTSRLNNSNLSQIGFISPDIEFSDSARNLNTSIIINNGAKSSKSVLTGEFGNLSGLYIEGALSMVSAVKDTLSAGRSIWVNRDKSVYSGPGLTRGAVRRKVTNIDNTCSVNQNKAFTVKTMAVLNKTRNLFKNSERTSKYKSTGPLRGHYYCRIQYNSDQMTSASAGYVASDGTTFKRRLNPLDFGASVSQEATCNISGYVNSGCADGLTHSTRFKVIGEANDNDCVFVSASMSGGHPMLSRYYYQSKVVHIADSSNKNRGGYLNRHHPSKIKLQINDYNYFGVEDPGRGKYETSGSEDFIMFNDRSRFRNVSIMNYLTAPSQHIETQLAGGGLDAYRARQFNAPIFGMTGANTITPSEDDITRRQIRKRLRTCPSHGGMALIDVNNGEMSNKMIVGCAAKKANNFTVGSNNDVDSEYDSTMIVVSNMRKSYLSAYGGVSKNNRDTLSTYTSFGDIPHKLRNSGVDSIPLFYGDTFIDVFDYTSCYITRGSNGALAGTLNSTDVDHIYALENSQKGEDVTKGEYGDARHAFGTDTISVQHQAYIPIETDINIALSSEFDPNKMNLEIDNNIFDNVRIVEGLKIGGVDENSGSTARGVNGSYQDVGCSTGVFRYAPGATGDSNDNYNINKDKYIAGYSFTSGGNFQYTYNDAYSSQNQLNTASPVEDIKTEEVFSSGNYDCRVVYSRTKNNNEVEDSYHIFNGAADKLDVDTRFGPITGLFKFKNQLVFWQDSSFGHLPVHERVFMNASEQNMDGVEAQIVLGTGTVLQSYEYYTTENGLKSRVKDVDGIYRYSSGTYTASNTALYWYDHSKAEIVIFGGGASSLSKAKGVQTHLQAFRDDFSDRLVTSYCNKYNEVLFTLRDVNDDDEFIEETATIIKFDTLLKVFDAEPTPGNSEGGEIIGTSIITSSIDGESTHWEAYCDADWVIMENDYGDDGDVLNFSLEKNKNPNPRNATISIYQEETERVIYIYINQAGARIIFEVSPTDIQVGGNASEVAQHVNVNSEVNYHDTHHVIATRDDVDWLFFSNRPKEDLVNDRARGGFSLGVTENNTGVDRTAKVVVTIVESEVSKVITIKQKHTSYEIDISPMEGPSSRTKIINNEIVAWFPSVPTSMDFKVTSKENEMPTGWNNLTATPTMLNANKTSGMDGDVVTVDLIESEYAAPKFVRAETLYNASESPASYSDSGRSLGEIRLEVADSANLKAVRKVDFDMTKDVVGCQPEHLLNGTIIAEGFANSMYDRPYTFRVYKSRLFTDENFALQHHILNVSYEIVELIGSASIVRQRDNVLDSKYGVYYDEYVVRGPKVGDSIKVKFNVERTHDNQPDYLNTVMLTRIQ